MRTQYVLSWSGILHTVDKQGVCVFPLTLFVQQMHHVKDILESEDKKYEAKQRQTEHLWKYWDRTPQNNVEATYLQNKRQKSSYKKTPHQILHLGLSQGSEVLLRTLLESNIFE